MPNSIPKGTIRMGRQDTGTTPLAPIKQQFYFLGIGIDHYLHWPDLNNAVRDMQAIQQLLQDQFGFTEEHSYTLINEQATRENILGQLDDLRNKLNSSDSILIYYAGHGHYEPSSKRGCLVPHEAKTSGTATLLRNSTIRDYLQDIASLHTLLISDACFSGSLLVERSSSAADISMLELSQLPSRWVISSGRHNEAVADGVKGEHSPFAQAILDVLRLTKRKGITVGFLGQEVITQTKHNYRGQLPDYGPIYGVGDKRGQFVFWENGTTTTQKAENTTQTSQEEMTERKNTPPVISTNLPTAPNHNKTTDLEEIIKQVKTYLAEDELRTALDYIQAKLKSNARVMNTILIQKGRLTRLEKKEAKGTLTPQQIDTQRNVLHDNILSTVEGVKEKELM